MTTTTETAAPFYVSDNCGVKKAGGKDFPTLDLAIKACTTTVRRRNSNPRAHGDTSYSVIHAVPGRHREVAYVTPDLEVVRR